jgi:hypothetical protein
VKSLERLPLLMASLKACSLRTVALFEEIIPKHFDNVSRKACSPRFSSSVNLKSAYGEIHFGKKCSPTTLHGLYDLFYAGQA